MKKELLFITFFFATLGANAQWDEEYKMEIGAGIGLLGYLGDYSSSLSKDVQPMASIVWRRVFNP